MRRIHLSTSLQTACASLATLLAALSLFGTAQLFGMAPMAAAVVARDAAMLRMSNDVTAMQRELEVIRREAQVHAARLDQRQAFLDAVLTGKAAPSLPASGQVSTSTATVLVPLKAAEARQVAMAERAQSAIDRRFEETARALGRIGISPDRLAKGAMGGPYEPVDSTAVRGQADPAFRELFQSWKRLDGLHRAAVAIPSHQPVQNPTITSGFGLRSDPFRGGAAMHAGIDIPGAHGTPIYATADGMVGRAGWANGYGQLVELEHGRGIQTRYGHLSSIVVKPGQRVKRGDLIARMGSTGRSTGTHLHYEVRLDGRAVNPMPFLQSRDYLAAATTRSRVAVGGPAE